MKTEQRQRLIGISPWVIVGSLIILLPILGIMSIERINEQKRSMFMLLDEKGAALIRSFEAGTRTGMMGMMGIPWSGQQVQRLLMETAQQPDILYILITNKEGLIVAHNNARFIGWKHGEFPAGAKIGSEIEARRLETADGRQVYEVYRRFNPSEGRVLSPGAQRLFDDWFAPHMSNSQAPPGQIIFVGFDMGPMEQVARAGTRQTIVFSLIMLLVAFSGIVTMLIAQNYRTARVALSRIKAFSDKVVANMPIGLIVIDPEGRIATTNLTTERILQRSAAELAGRPAGDLPGEISQVIASLEPGSEVVEHEVQCRVGDKRIDLEVSVGALREDEFLGHLVLLRDVSEIRHLKTEIERKERLASLGSLAAGIAHEIRNPLSSIKGFATYFKERYQDVEQDAQTAEIMISEVDRLNRVIGELLEFARPMEVHPARVDLAEFMRTTLRKVQPNLDQKGITCELDLQELETCMDPDRMTQVLMNIYLNAIEAMPQGGRLLLTTARQAQGPGRAQGLPAMIVIGIRDNGGGIKPEDLGHIFDPYFTTKSTGTGLGLAIAHKIVTAHGGDIQVVSPAGEGTTFTIRLPYAREE